MRRNKKWIQKSNQVRWEMTCKAEPHDMMATDISSSAHLNKKCCQHLPQKPPSFFWSIYNIILATEVFTKTCFSQYTSLHCNFTNHPKQENSMCCLNAPLVCCVEEAGCYLVSSVTTIQAFQLLWWEMRQTSTAAHPKIPREGFDRNNNRQPFS